MKAINLKIIFLIIFSIIVFFYFFYSSKNLDNLETELKNFDKGTSTNITEISNPVFKSKGLETNSYTIKAISSNISLDRFYSKKDELKIIIELIDLSTPTKVKPTIYLWPEGIIPDSYLSEMNIYKDLFLDNFGKDDLIIIGINSMEKKNDKKTHLQME